MMRMRGVLLVLCAVVGLVAFGAAAAQAEKNSQWLVLDNNGALKTDLEAALAVEVEGTQILHTKIAGVQALFECKKLEGVGTVIKAGGKISGATFRARECKTRLNGVISEVCDPQATGEPKGVITSSPLHALIELHELANGTKDPILRFLPDSGEVFWRIETTEECSLGEVIPIIGKASLKDCEAMFSTHLVKHLVEPGPLTELWAISKTAEHVALPLGSAWMLLSGAHQGFKFAGDAG